MAERGGYRKPKKGAQVSPPGALSRRKEREKVKNSRQGIMGSGGYGSTKEAQELASSAPFASKTPTPQVQVPQSTRPAEGGMAGVVPLTAPTQRPMESPEVGMPFGEGPGPVDVGLMPGAGMQESIAKQDLRKLANYLPAIELAANAEGAPQTLRTFVKYLRSL